jgi:hypothetical protein
VRHQTVTTRRTEEPEDVLHCFQDECAKCCGLSESYARPGRCVNEACDGRMVAVKYVRAEEVQTLRDQLKRAAAALEAIRDHGKVEGHECWALHQGDCADVFQEIARATLHHIGGQ